MEIPNWKMMNAGRDGDQRVGQGPTFGSRGPGFARDLRQ